MAFGWDQTVAVPGGASYNAPLLNFNNIANWFRDFQQGQLGDQAKQLNSQALQTGQQQQTLNDQRIAEGQRQQALATAFPNGLPTDPRTGTIDYGKVAATLAKFGDVGDAVTLLQQQPVPPPAIFGGGGGGGGPGVAPASVPARPLPPPAANSPKGDSGVNTVTALVTDKLPSQNQTTGQTIMKIAEVLGVDPNADLTPGQVRRAQGLLSKYAPEVTGTTVGGAKASALPPSANAGTPSPGAPQEGAPTGAAAAQPAPQAPQPRPIGIQEPLPPGYTDPEKAIRDLRLNAARLSGDPRKGSAQYAAQMNAWADRIENSIKPIDVGASTTKLDPRTGEVIYQGPAAAAYGKGESGATLDADAETYRQTGKLPPNMGRGIQGATQATKIRERAAELEAESGGDTKDWPTRWQTFASQATGARVLQQRATNLRLAENEASSLIPRVREASAKINRTQYPTLNSLILASQKGSGGQDVVKFGIAVSSLIPVYARVLKPTGQITEGDTHRATEILDKAWSDGQINAALDQMEIELDSAKAALQKTIDEQSGKKKTETSGSTAQSGGEAKWVTLPNGVRIREKASN